MTNSDIDPELKNTRQTHIIEIIAIAIIAVAAVIYVIITNSGSGGDQIMTPQGKITDANGIITVENQDIYNWTQIWFRLDTVEKPGAYDYKYEADLIEAHKSLQIDITQFQGDNGSMFNPAVVHPKAMYFWFNTAAGEGKLNYDFK
jgi:hypothetical protein